MQLSRTLIAAIGYIAAAVALCTPGGAQAADTKVIPAISCIRAAHLQFSTSGAYVFNSSVTNGGNITCPLVRDNTSAKPLRIEISVFDKSSVTSPAGAGDVSCQAYFASRFGSSYIASARSKTLSGASNTGQILRLQIPISVHALGGYAVSCYIPRRQSTADGHSSISSILIEE